MADAAAYSSDCNEDKIRSQDRSGDEMENRSHGQEKEVEILLKCRLRRIPKWRISTMF